MNFACTAMHKRVGTVWHMLPTQAQAKRVIWNGIDRQGRRIIDQVFPLSIRDGEPNKQDMSIQLKCGSIYQLVGSDNYNGLVGGNPVGIIFSEYSVADPAAWDFLRPILLENGGWALFIYTARGRNHGATLFEMAKGNPKWFAELLTVDDTNVVSPEDIAEERRSGMPEDMIEQEYYCSFEAAIVGAYYGRQLVSAEKSDRIIDLAYDSTMAVDTLWSFGPGDTVSIWFRQNHGAEYHFLDYYEATGEALAHYAKVLQERGYLYGRHLASSNIGASQNGTGKSRRDKAKGLQLNFTVVPELMLDDGIDAVRGILPRCWFDKQRCARGIEALRQYRKEWDEQKKVFKDRPLIDWTNAGALAFMTGAIAREPRSKTKLNLGQGGSSSLHGGSPQGWMG